MNVENELVWRKVLEAPQRRRRPSHFWTLRFSGMRRPLCFLAAIAAALRSRGACPTVSRHDECKSRETVKRRHGVVAPFHGSCIRLLNVSAGQAPQLRTVAVTRLKHFLIANEASVPVGQADMGRLVKLQDSSREPRAPVGQANWG